MSLYVNVIYEEVTANGTTIASTTVLNPNCEYHNIATCTSTNYGVLLGQFKLGSVHHIKNSGVHSALIFPANASSIINGETAGVGFWLAAAGGECDVIAVSNSNETKPVVNYQVFNKSGVPVVPITANANYTVNAIDNGATFNLPATATTAGTITMPAPTTSSLKYSFVCGADMSTKTWTIACGAGLLDAFSCYQTNGATTGEFVLGDAAANAVVSATAKLGTQVDLISNGTSWIGRAFSPSSNTGVSFT